MIGRCKEPDVRVAEYYAEHSKHASGRSVAYSPSLRVSKKLGPIPKDVLISTNAG